MAAVAACMMADGGGSGGGGGSGSERDGRKDELLGWAVDVVGATEGRGMGFGLDADEE